jgi:hypothetical protein
LATILGIFPLLLPFLGTVVKTPEGVVVGFQIFAWAPKKNNNNSGNKPGGNPPWPPGFSGWSVGQIISTNAVFARFCK